MDITFRCDRCSQHIVIDEAGAGLTVQCPECGQTLTVPQAQPRPSKPSGWLPVSIRFSEPHAQSGPSKPPTPTTPNDVATKEPLPPAWTLESVPKAVASTPPGDMPPVTRLLRRQQTNNARFAPRRSREKRGCAGSVATIC